MRPERRHSIFNFSIYLFFFTSKTIKNEEFYILERIEVLVESPEVSFGSLNLNGLKKDLLCSQLRSEERADECQTGQER